MANDAVSEVKARIDIIDVIAGYVALQRAGREFKGLCPFHGEKTPSFTVSPERQAWYCFGCSEGGDVFAFVQKVENVDFRQALELLAERAGVEIEDRPRGGESGSSRRKKVVELNTKAAAYFEHVLWKTDAGRAGREVLATRGVDEETARLFGIGFAPAGGAGEDALVRYLTGKGGATVAEVVEAGLAHARGNNARDRFRQRLIFPIREERGGVIAFGGRAMGDNIPKYLNSPETPAYHKSNALFGIDLARETLRSDHQVLVVEGYFDVIAARRAGIHHVVASSGTAFTKDQARILARYADAITFCFDGDAAGIAAASKAVDTVAAEGLSARLVVLPEGSKDPDEVVQRDPQEFVDLVKAAKPEWQVLLGRAIGDSPGGDVDQRRRAAERAVAVLARIPVAATRDLYGQQAAAQLGLDARALAADVERARRGEKPRPLRVTPPVAAPSQTADSATEKPLAPPSAPEEYIGSVLVRKPSFAQTLAEPLGLHTDELNHPHIRQILTVAGRDEAEGGFPLHLLDAGAQATAARLALVDVPELEEASTERVEAGLSDAVRRLREATIRSSIADLQRSEQPDPDQLQRQIAELAKVRKA